MKKGDTLLDIKNMSFSYGERIILDDVDLSFKLGSVVAIMGGSGMGKTTLLKLIGGLLTPQKGTVTFAGQKVDTSDSAALYKLEEAWECFFNSARYLLT